MTAGPEEPNALVQVERADGVSEPMVRATTLPLEEGLRAWSLAGKGRLVDAVGRRALRQAVCARRGAGGRGGGVGADGRGRCPRGGPGARVLVLDADPTASGEGVLADTTALGVYDHGYVTAVQRRPTPRTEGRLWHIRAGRIVIATGATERPIVFADDDRPGIMLASAAAAYIERYGVRPGSRAAVFTNNDTTDRVAAVLRSAGVEIVADRRRSARRYRGRHGSRRRGPAGVRRDRPWAVDGLETVDADLLLVSGGWNPNVALWSQARGSLRFDERIAAFVPDRPGPHGRMEAVGAAAGDIADLGRIEPAWIVPPPGDDPGEDAWATHYVDLQRDSTARDLRRALEAGLTSIEHVKRYTTIGTAADQGKTSGVVASAIAAAILGQEVGAVGVPTYRPPVVPVSFAQLAGRDRGDLLDPIRVTPIHDWHVAHGAVFEDVGQWKRPRYFPVGGESMEAAVLRECAVARTGVAVMDATTLGKIDLQGPDAAVFLDRVYTNTFSTLKVGACRYGVMCRVDGMVFDDGVTSRLADDRFQMTTTTGNAAPVLEHLEEWLQTEWPGLRVRATSVTEQWATVAVVGPRSRDVVATLAPGLDVGIEAFPFMTWRDAVDRGDRRARVPDLVLRGAGVRAQRAVGSRAGPMGGRDGRRCPARDHALRHGDHARPSRREGLPDHRPGDGRDRDAAGPRPGRAGLDEEGLHRAPIAATAGQPARPTASSSSGCCRSTPTSCSPRAPSWWRSMRTSRASRSRCSGT